MALGAFGAYLGGLGDSDMAAAQQNALSQLMNMQASNQSMFGQNMLNPYHSAQGIGTAIGGLQQYAQQFQQSYPPPPIVEPKQAQKRKAREPEDDFKATDDDGLADAIYAAPAWKRRLMKRYPEGVIIGGFVRRLALELDIWHANAAGLPA